MNCARCGARAYALADRVCLPCYRLLQIYEPADNRPGCALRKREAWKQKKRARVLARKKQRMETNHEADS